MHVTTRPGSPDDIEFAFQSKRSTMRRHVEALWGWDDADQRRRHREQYLAHEFNVVQCDGVDVGALVLDRSPEGYWLSQLFIQADRTGQGIGTALMTQICEEAKAQAVPVKLQVLHPNTRAADFYLKLGFKEVGQTETHRVMERQP